jgi:hypothetical protein
MERSPLRKPKLYFDACANPSHVTFDDGKDQRRNLPWMHYVEARWDYAEPDTIKIEVGDWLVVVRGHNLAQPELQADREHEADTFAVEIRFTKPLTCMERNRRGQIELDLDR